MKRNRLAAGRKAEPVGGVRRGDGRFLANALRPDDDVGQAKLDVGKGRQQAGVKLLGAGMMRPEVLRNGGIDPDVYQGFAFGMGLDRLAMRRFAIDDIRNLYANEEQFLSQF